MVTPLPLGLSFHHTGRVATSLPSSLASMFVEGRSVEGLAAVSACVCVGGPSRASCEIAIALLANRRVAKCLSFACAPASMFYSAWVRCEAHTVWREWSPHLPSCVRWSGVFRSCGACSIRVFD